MCCRTPLHEARRVVAFVGRIAGPPQPYHRALLRACALACHDTIHCIVTQGWKMGSSPSSFPAQFFFSLFQVLQDHKKKKKLYIYFMSSVEQNKFIKIYFIYIFFSSFTHCKTSKKKFLQYIFFPMCYSPSTQFTLYIHNNSYTTHDHTSIIKCTMDA